MNLIERYDALQTRVNALRVENTERIAGKAKAEEDYHCAYEIYVMRMNGFRVEAADFDRRWRDVEESCEALTREIFVAVAGEGEG